MATQPGGFNNLGSTPTLSLGKNPGMIGSTLKFNTSATTPQTANFARSSAPVVHPTTSAPVKKQITTDASGNTTETHYATPTVQQDPLMAKVTSAPAKTPEQMAAGNNIGTSPGSAAPITPENKANAPVTYPGLINRAVEVASQPSADYQAQLAEANKYNEALKRSRMNEAGALSANAQNPIPLEFQQGRGQVLQSQYANEQAALGSAMQGAASLVPATTSQQSIQQSGLLSAAGLTPEALRYGETAGTLNPLNNLDSIAQQVISGQISPAQAKAMGGNISTWEGALNQAILKKNPNYNEATAQGAYDARQTSTGTQAMTVEGYKSALQQGQNLQTQLTDLITTFGLNPNDVNKVNMGLQIIANNVSDPRYKILQNYVNDIANTYAQILTPPGGSATDTTRGIASSMLDSSMAGNGLITVMKSLDEAANAKISGVKTEGAAGRGTSTGNTWGDIFG